MNAHSWKAVTQSGDIAQLTALSHHGLTVTVGANHHVGRDMRCSASSITTYHVTSKG